MSTALAVDATLRDDRGRHSAAFFVQWVPYELKTGRWDEGGRLRPAPARHRRQLRSRFLVKRG